jgi:hypothetical protein
MTCWNKHVALLTPAMNCPTMTCCSLGHQRRKRRHPNVKNKVQLKSRFTVPIFGARILLVVADDAVTEFNRHLRYLDADREEKDGFRALTTEAYLGRIGVFFHTAKINHNDIAHELDHARDHILAWIGATPPRPKRIGKKTKEALAEPAAYIRGYLAERFYKLFKKHSIKLDNP